MTGPARQPVSGGGFAALIAGRAARAYGAAPPASRLLRIADATALRAGLDPGASAAPRAGNTNRPRPAPPSARPAPRSALQPSGPHPYQEGKTCDQVIPHPPISVFPSPSGQPPGKPCGRQEVTSYTIDTGPGCGIT